jgi:integrase
MSTRRRHFGSVRKLPSGRWQASWWHEGSRHVATDTFAMKADALSYLSTVEADISRGVNIDPRAGRITVRELAEEWFSSNPGKRRGSLQRDEAILRLHVLPDLGRKQVSSVTKVEVQNLVRTWSAERAPRTVRRQYDVLRAVFAYAVATDRIGRSPCRSIKLPQPEALDRPSLSPADIARLAAATPAPLRPMIWIGGVLGLRWGEVAGLQAGAIDFERRELVVARQLGRDRTLGPPKSSAGHRSMTVPETLCAILAEHVSLFCRSGPDSLLFTSESGRALDYTRWRRRVWMPATVSAGLVGAGFHDLRRAAATFLVTEGVDVKTAQTRLGHSDPRLTLGIYARASSQADRGAADRLGERFFGRPEQAPGG